MKTMKKTLAIFLSVLMALSVCSIVSFAATVNCDHPEAYQIGFEESEDQVWISIDPAYDDYYQSNFGKGMYDYYVTDRGYTYWYCPECGVYYKNAGGEGDDEVQDGWILHNLPAAEPVFTQIPTADSDALADGNYYFDVEGFIEDYPVTNPTLAEFYRGAAYYISDDANTIFIKMNEEDEGAYFERSNPSYTAYFANLKQHGDEIEDETVWTQLYLVESEEDLADIPVGAWYADLSVFAAYFEDGDSVEVYTDEYLNFKIVVNGEETVIENGETTEAFSAAIQMRDTNSGWVLLPLSADGLNPGDKYFDKAACIADDEELTEENFEDYMFLRIYIDLEGNLKAVILVDYGGEILEDETILGIGGEDWEYFNSYVKTVPSGDAPEYEGFTLLPTADSDDLADGAWWFALDSFIEDQTALIEDPEEAGYQAEYFRNCFYYLSEDGTIVRSWDGEEAYDTSAENVQDYLHQHEAAVDPFEGFTLLPTEDSDDLEVGAYYFDVEGFIEAAIADGMSEEMALPYRNLSYYINDDFTTVGIDTGDGLYTFTAESDPAIFAFLKQHEAGPSADDQAAADAVIAAIDDIGEVAYTAESKALIDAADEAYAALTDAQKALVTNADVLTTAKETYAQLKAEADAAAEAAANQAAADEVIAKINAIGEVAYTDESKAKIDAAKDAYNALTDAQKALVTNADAIAAAEARYAELKAAAEPEQPTDDGNKDDGDYNNNAFMRFLRKIIEAIKAFFLKIAAYFKK